MARLTKYVKFKLCNSCRSFDRIYPKKAYIKGNIVVVSNKANRIKTDATVDEIRKVADFYEKLLKVNKCLISII